MSNNIKFCSVCKVFVDLEKDCKFVAIQDGPSWFNLKLYNHTCGTTLCQLDVPDPENLSESMLLIDKLCEVIEEKYYSQRKAA